METNTNWISVDDRLPDEKGEYLVAYHPCGHISVYWDKTEVGLDSFRGKTAWAKNKFQRVTHWMPKPEPPKATNAKNAARSLTTLRGTGGRTTPSSVMEIVADYLKNNGYDGLYNSDAECGCDLDELMPCEGSPDSCQPGYKVGCGVRITEVSE